MNREELWSVAEIIGKLTERYRGQLAEHEAKMAEHRAAFGARTEADRQIIAGLREESAKYKAERDDLYQREGIEQKRRMDVEDERNALRAEVAELKTQLERLTSWAVKNQAARETLQSEIERLKSQIPKQHPVAVGEWVKRTQSGMWPIGATGKVAVVLEGAGCYELTSGETWDWRACEPCDPPTEATHDTPVGKRAAEAVVRVADLPSWHCPRCKRTVSSRESMTFCPSCAGRLEGVPCVSATSVTEPVADEIKVGDLVEVFQATDANWTRADEIGIKGTVQRINMSGRMIPVVYLSNDGAYALRDVRKIRRGPKPGDTVRLVRIPSRDDVSSELKTELEWPWIERWGTLNQTALVVEPAYQLDGALSVCLSTNVHVRWPISCIEVITEATHDTEAGKAAAQNAEKTEQVADEIKVGDLVEVVSNRGRNTWLVDVGSLGIVTSVEDINDSISVHLDDVPGKRNALAGYVSFCDVRKVTT